MIRNIVFDMGNVLVDYTPDVYAARAAENAADARFLRAQVFGGPEWPKLDAGAISEAEGWASIEARIPLPLKDTARRLFFGWHDHIVENQDMTTLVKALRQAGMRLYLLSNAALSFHKYRGRIASFGYLDGILLSAEEKAVKPGAEIYRRLFEKFDLQPEECLFIDDMPENIEGARNCGMDGHCFLDGDVPGLIRALLDRGVGFELPEDFAPADKGPFTARDMLDRLKRGQVTAHALIMRALARIARMDGQGPRLNAVLEVNPQAEGIARMHDAHRASGAPCGPLCGIPVLLKDNIDTGDMMHTSAGALALADRFAPKDAFVVRRLREAGAVILGKANMTEFANIMADDMANGYSSRGGQVKSPWGEYDPSGSSTGSAVGVAAGYVPIAIGTETLGSITSPAGEAGIAAIKPTVGLVSRSGILPISVSLDTAGPMGRTLMDCAVCLEAISGPDEADPITLAAPPAKGYVRAVRQAPHSLKGVRLGLENRNYEGNPVHNRAFLHALAQLEALGAEILEVRMPGFPSFAGEIMTHELRACMDRALLGSEGCPRTLFAIAQYNREHPEACLKYGQAGLDRALEKGAGLTNPAYVKARMRAKQEYCPGIERVFAQKGIEAYITPVCTHFAAGGYPSVTIPVGMHRGRPVPIVFSGLRFQEHRLLEIAGALERALGFENAPFFGNGLLGE